MDVKNKNRIGYKKTKVGWIPEDWDCVFIDPHIQDLRSGLSRLLSNTDIGLPMLRSTNIVDGTIDFTDVKYWHKDDPQGADTSRYILQNGDIVVNFINSMAQIGKCALYEDRLGRDTIYTTNIFRLCLNKELNSKFFFLITLTERYRNFILSITKPAVNQASFTTKEFRKFRIALPSLPEQEAIAGVLECWDKAIRNYEKKIEKKRNIKKGLMQRLLSGKQRLPGFLGEWKKVVFGEVFELLKTYAFSREKLTLKPQESAEIYNIHYGDIHAIYTGYALDLEKERAVPLIKKATEIPSNPVLLQEGDLIIADVSEDYEGVGACVELRNIGNRKVTGGLHTFVARDKRGHSALGYRSFLLKHPAFAKRMKQISTGVSVHGISKGNLLKEKISLPPLHEQQAIACVLSAADSEIEAMERKLVILKDQKKFLLNNLVTGTIRLPQFRGGPFNPDSYGENT